ncbi:alpha-ketoacid dehydrogenase subunit beta [Ferrimicrobium acidiphilum]|uniref:alpha-ketoacid dehydrogenase subunit beta n=1 Tax=Ferrimicrobium acidiphilum TaxID=121039 RepID=UPI0023F16414|nr:transketolase C-terminal domain-containing protein [Ferrimicrobium acidiphilum]
MSSQSLIQAARSALLESMNHDRGVLVLGEDVASGGPFGLTKGLAEEFGTDRVRNTPISESFFIGVGIGLALAGARPLVDIMFNDFLTLVSDQLFNQDAKIHFMSGGRHSVPLTVWTIGGAGTRWGAQHSQRLDGWLTQIPGIKVLAPSSPAMMFKSMKAALADHNPVVLMVDRSLLHSQEDLPGDNGSPWNSRIVLPGRDLTLVSTGRLIHLSLDVAQSFPGRVEIIDLQRTRPIGVDLIRESVTKTGKLLVVHDEVSNGGFLASIALAIYDSVYFSLDAPIAHLTSLGTPVPAAPELEDAFLIDSLSIKRAITEILET